MQWQWLIGPAIGGVIGYITNDIAVRMMFRPHTEKRLWGKRIPFTPGIIPKGRPRLAKSIRDVLDHDLLSAEVIASALLSPEMVQKTESAVDQVLSSILSEKRTPRMFLASAFGEEALSAFEAEAKRAVGIFLMEKILESGIEKPAATLIVEEAKKRVKGSPAAPLALFFDEKRSVSMEEKLAQSIREMIATHLPDMVDGMIEKAASDGLDTPLGVLAQKYGEKAGDIRAFIMDQYKLTIEKVLPMALHALDLGTIVEEKLNALSMTELETLIMQVMRKELRAIVWLGALLGGIIGIANTFVPMLF